MPASKQLKFELRIQRQRIEARRGAVRREAFNNAPACPWIYRGFEEPPSFGTHRGGTINSADLETRLCQIDKAAYANWRRHKPRGTWSNNPRRSRSEKASGR